MAIAPSVYFYIVGAVILVVSLIFMFITPSTGGVRAQRRRNVASTAFIFGLALIIIGWIIAFTSG
ncbi:MAG TPA: hypothetical protein VFF68_00020 [Anaerolineaceae bacterium]|nr:hypothetical protein [Anaerolineaceae bacterium]